MKKPFLLLLALLITSIFSFSACDTEQDTLMDTNMPTDDTLNKNPEGNGDETEKDPVTEVCMHAFSDWTVEKNATCKEQGLLVRICTACGEEEATKINTTDNHSEVVDEAKEATCTETGLTEGKHCSSCGCVFVAQIETPKISHIYTDDYDASCNECDFEREIENCDIGLLYEINDGDETCTVTGIGTFEGEKLEIPNYINGYKVTAIGEKAFENCTQLTKLTIPKTTETIGTRAFYGCIGLTEFTVPESVTDVGTQIFYKAENLSTVYYNSSYSSISNPFLNLSHITKVIFGGEIIPDSILKNCENVYEIVISDGVTSIDDWAFSGCTGLKNIIFSNSVKYVNYDVFDGCTSLESVRITDLKAWCEIHFEMSDYGFPSNPLKYAHNLYLNETLVTHLDFPESLSEVLLGSFYGCSSIKSVVIPDSVNSIGAQAFAGCTSLDAISISENVKKIDSLAFSSCTSLRNIIFPNNISSIGYGAFNECSSLDDIVIPSSVTSIGNRAFAGCSSLKDIQIPNSISNISCVFENCTSLVNMTIPDSVIYIEGVFRGCTALNTVVVPDSVITIGSSAFNGCTSLTNIVIPNTITSINSFAFYQCDSLANVYYFGDQDDWDTITIDSLNVPLENATRYYYSQSTPTTKGNFWRYVDGVPTPWPEYVELTYSTGLAYTLNDDGESYSVSGIGTCTDIEIIIPSEYNGKPVNAIGDEAFYQCSNIVSVTIPEGITVVPYSAFKYCTNLERVEIPRGVTSIELDAFRWCENLDNVVLPSSVVTIGMAAFSHCENLRSIALGEGLKTIGYEAFAYCSSLQSIEIPDNVQTLESRAFADCVSLSSVAISKGVKSIWNYAFSGCTVLLSVTFENPVGWYYSSEYNAINGTDISSSDLCNTATAAKYLTEKYYIYYWKRD